MTVANLHMELRNHPAQAQFKGKPLVDENGDPVPLFPDQRSVYVDGQCLAYCDSKPGGGIRFTEHVDPPVADAVEQYVRQHIGEVAAVGIPPERKQPEPKPESIEDLGTVRLAEEERKLLETIAGSLTEDEE